MKRRSSFLAFLKAQVSAFLGGMTDYAVMIILTELVYIHYTYSILVSGILGAFVNFSLNRRWAFKSDGVYLVSKRGQVLRFSCVITGSVVLKSAGTFLLTSAIQTDYKISRVLVDLVVSYGFNYPLIRYWVFKQGKNEALTTT